MDIKRILGCMWMNPPTGRKWELIWSMLSFLTVVFAILLCFLYRKIINSAPTVLDEIPQVYKTDTSYIYTRLEQNIFTLPSLVSNLKEEKSVRAIMNMSNLIIIIFTILDIPFVYGDGAVSNHICCELFFHSSQFPNCYKEVHILKIFVKIVNIWSSKII